jgi:hypothetical protein
MLREAPKVACPLELFVELYSFFTGCEDSEFRMSNEFLFMTTPNPFSNHKNVFHLACLTQNQPDEAALLETPPGCFVA